MFTPNRICAAIVGLLLSGPLTPHAVSLENAVMEWNQVALAATATAGQGPVPQARIMTIVQVGASLEYRLKHFNPDLTGWEEKGQVVRFPLVAVEKDAWYFDGLTVRRDGPDGMVGAVRIDSKEGPPREAVFKYRRVK